MHSFDFNLEQKKQSMSTQQYYQSDQKLLNTLLLTLSTIISCMTFNFDARNFNFDHRNMTLTSGKIWIQMTAFLFNFQYWIGTKVSWQTLDSLPTCNYQKHASHKKNKLKVKQQNNEEGNSNQWQQQPWCRDLFQMLRVSKRTLKIQ